MVVHKWNPATMTKRDIEFLRAIGVEPCLLDGPFPSSLPPPLPSGPLISSLTEKDALWLLSFGVMWEQESEPGFTTPRNLREYLARYPNGIREAVKRAAKELRIAQSENVEVLAQDVIVILLDFSTDLDDIVEMYPFQPPMPHGGCRSEHFHRYIGQRVRAVLLTLLRNRRPHGY
jgi:hypothetical protein